MKLLQIYLLGLGIVFGATMLTILANSFGVVSWHDFVAQTKTPGVFSYLWLFVIYPFALGLISFVIYQLLRK